MRIKSQDMYSANIHPGPCLLRAMKTLPTMNTRIQTALFIALTLVAGCATKKPAPANYVFFPSPPDEPRIQYLMSYGSEADLGGPSKFTQFVAGEEKVLRPIWKPYGVAINDG